MTDTETLGRAGMDHLIESVLLVLQYARDKGELLGPKEIGERAGIPEVSKKNQEIVTGVLHYLKDNEIVKNKPRRYWQLVPGEYGKTYVSEKEENK